MRMVQGMGVMVLIGAMGAALAAKGKEPAQKPAAPDNAKAASPTLPKFKPLFDYPMRDPFICVGPDKTYYLIGTTGHPTWWHVNDGIRLWKSKDLAKWEPMGMIWSFEKNTTWQKPRSMKEGDKNVTLHAVWAPELHYIKGTYWIPYCMNYHGTGILRSTTGKPEGPYEDVRKDGPLTDEIDASLFIDDDGKIYFVFQDGKIARMKDDLSGLAEKPRLLKPANAGHVGFEGATVTKIGKRYYLICAEMNPGNAYDCMCASADSVYGPYGDRYLVVPHGGHNMFFKDPQGQWWSTFFGTPFDPGTPFAERPALLRITVGPDGRVAPNH